MSCMNPNHRDDCWGKRESCAAPDTRCCSKAGDCLCAERAASREREKERKQALSEPKPDIRAAALAKLTIEERRALGL